jgi:hypothetical protein
MRVAYIVVFIGTPLMAVLGFLMFRYPQAWAKLNARSARKELHAFDSPKQLAHTRQLGILIMLSAGLSLGSVFAVKALMQSFQSR